MKNTVDLRILRILMRENNVDNDAEGSMALKFQVRARASFFPLLCRFTSLRRLITFRCHLSLVLRVGVSPHQPE